MRIRRSNILSRNVEHVLFAINYFKSTKNKLFIKKYLLIM